LQCLAIAYFAVGASRAKKSDIDGVADGRVHPVRLRWQPYRHEERRAAGLR
jgi:hypothetical protein